MWAEYLCDETQEKIEVKKKYGKDLPDTIRRNGKVYKRFFSRMPYVDVGQGFGGNAKDGYSGDKSMYHPSRLTPNSSLFGKYGRSVGVESEELG